MFLNANMQFYFKYSALAQLSETYLRTLFGVFWSRKQNAKNSNTIVCLWDSPTFSFGKCFLSARLGLRVREIRNGLTKYTCYNKQFRPLEDLRLTWFKVVSNKRRAAFDYMLLKMKCLNSFVFKRYLTFLLWSGLQPTTASINQIHIKDLTK